MENKENTRVNLPNCHACKFFYVTWQASYPYGCNAFSMKCKNIPAKEVFQRSGLQCLYFEQKNDNFMESTKGDENEITSKKRMQSKDFPNGKTRRGKDDGYNFLV